MNDRLSRIKANVRFGLWKAKTYHPTRYISFIILIATLVGASFFASNNTNLFIKRASAAAQAIWTPNGAFGGTLDIGGQQSKYMLLKGGGCHPTNESSLIPMNYDSASKITNNGVANFIGRVCIPTASNSAVTINVHDSAELSIVGDTTVGNVAASLDGVITTAPADAHGKAVPYATKDDFWAVRFTGFIEINNTSPIVALYTVEPMAFNGGSWDDSLVVEIDDVAIDTGNINNRNNFRVFSWKQFACNSTDHLFHQSFYKTSDTCNGGAAGQLTAASQARSLSVPPGQHFYAISIMGWESSGKARFAVGTTKNGGIMTTVRSNNLYNGHIDPFNGTVGSIDFGSSGNMRFEYGIGALTGTNRAVARDFSNIINIGGQYYFFPTVNLSGTFRGFDQINAGDWSYFFDDPTETIAGEPFSNVQNGKGTDTGTDYRIGARPNDVTKVTLMQNYKLQNHETADNMTAIDAGLRLNVAGSVTLASGGRIDVSNKGLPGGAKFGGIDGGVAGIGGYGHAVGTPSWWQAFDNDSVFGGNSSPTDSLIHGGGGAGGGNSGTGTRWAGGGGGGGVIGAGAGGMNLINNIVSKNVYWNGAGGAGIAGLGGGLLGTPGTNNIVQPGIIPAGLAGGSNRGKYSSPLTTGLGGGAGTGAGSAYSDSAGSGGGSVKLSAVNLTMTSGSIKVNGEEKMTNPGPGGGGAGTVNLRLSGTINLDGTSYITANGGDTIVDTIFSNGSINNGYNKGGEGGGGLVKIRATTYAGAGLPPIEDYCKDLGNPFKPKHANLEAKKGGGLAEDGIIDIGTYDPVDEIGKPICSGTNTGNISPDVQISKRLQQWSGATVYRTTEPEYRGQIDIDGNWVDSVTTVPSTYLRVQIVIRNPSNTDRTVIITDTVPRGVDLVPAPGIRENVEIRTNGANQDYRRTLIRVGEKVTVPDVPVAKETTVEVMYVVQVNQI